MAPSDQPLHYFDELQDLALALDEHLARADGVFVLTDSHVARYALPLVMPLCDALGEADVVEVDPGEGAKDLAICQHLWAHLLECGASRRSLLLCVGGGVVTDLGGFTGATYKRGIPFIHVPTSLMAMTDASIGGKTALNCEGVKNAVGTFTPARDILICPEFLDTLPEEELLSGFAEMLKHALIGDAGSWHDLIALEELSRKTIEPYLLASITVKTEICATDPLEAGPRKLLNFGHSIGHALEACLLAEGRPVSHGHAVAVGMMAETLVSMEACGLPEDSAQMVLRHLGRRYAPDRAHLPSFDALLPYLRNDKKNDRGDRYNFTLIEEIGQGRTDVPVETDLARKCWDKLLNG